MINRRFRRSGPPLPHPDTEGLASVSSFTFSAGLSHYVYSWGARRTDDQFESVGIEGFASNSEMATQMKKANL